MIKKERNIQERAGRIVGLLLLFLLAAPGLRAQVNGEDKWGSWLMYFGTNRVSDAFSIHTEAQFRYWEVGSNFNQMLLRTGANFHLTEQAIATAGYAYILTDGSFEEPAGALDSREHRLFLQFILKNRLRKLAFEHRYRLEQRFISLGDANDTQYRARYRLQLTHPINEVFFVNGYDEVFLNLQGNVFGQNRLYLALGAKLSPEVSVQAGYLKNHFPNAHYDRLQLGVFFNPDFRDKEAAP